MELSEGDMANQRDEVMKLFQDIKRHLADGSRGHLIAAEVAMRVADDWDKYRESFGGLDVSVVLKKHFNFHLSYFAVRKHAIDVLGRDIKSWMADDLAVWVVRSVPEPERERVMAKLAEESAAQRKMGLVMTRPQGERVVHALLGHRAVRRPCGRCIEKDAEIERLRAILVANGIDEAGRKDAAE